MSTHLRLPGPWVISVRRRISWAGRNCIAANESAPTANWSHECRISRFGIVLLHGLLTNGQTGEEQLATLIARIKSIPGVTIIVPALFDPLGPSPLLRIVRGTFGGDVNVQSILNQTLVCGDGESLIVVGYSAGGWGFYEWANSRDRGNEAVALAVIIGSPLRVLPGSLARFGPGNGTKLRAWDHLDEAKIARTTKRLHIIHSNGDLVVQPWNSVIRNVADSPLLSSRSFEDISHENLIVNQSVLDAIASAIEQSIKDAQ